MTAVRDVWPKRAWDARSVSPAYASTSTMRPLRRPVAESRTIRVPSRARAASSAGPARTALSRTVRGAGSACGVEASQRLGHDRSCHRKKPWNERVAVDHGRLRDGVARRVVRLVDRAQARELVVARGLAGDREPGVENDDHRAEDDRALDDPQQAAQHL